MIDFALEPELELLRETARHFAAEQLRPRERAHESARAIDAPVRRAFREIGLAAVEWPERLGGAGLGALAGALVLEELAACDVGAALALDPLGPAFHALAECGGEAALVAHALPLVERGDARAVLVRNDPRLVTERAGRVSGVVPWVPADRVDLVVLLDADSVSVIDTGFTATPLRGAGLRAAGASELRLVAAPLREHWVNAAGARRALARARLHAASLLVGVMRAAAEFSRDYAQTRVAFGRPIAHHQALAFLIADMAMAVEGTRLLVHEAAVRLDGGGVRAAACVDGGGARAAACVDRGDDGSGACATAFTEAAEQAMFVTPNAVQILGGHGFMQDYPVEKWMREARVLGLGLGGVDAARDDAAALWVGTGA